MTPDPKIALMVFFGTILIAVVFLKTDLIKKVFGRNIRIKTQIEDILKQLYHVEYSGRKASLNAMGGALKINDNKLVELIEYMTDMDLITFRNNTLTLTDHGRDYALKIIRVHRIWEKYLSEKTGIHKSQWHKEAEKKEHTMSPDETEKLYQSLGSPRYDPHGDPIPLRTGEIISTTGVPLSGLAVGTNAKITHLEDEPEVIYRQLLKLKIHIGQQLKILETDDTHITYYSEGEESKLSTIAASNIGVRIMSEEEVFDGERVRLSSLKPNEKAQVVGISKECRGAARRRLLDLGFIKGASIETGLDGPLKEPKAYFIKNTLIALRNDQADLILIEKMS